MKNMKDKTEKTEKPKLTISEQFERIATLAFNATSIPQEPDYGFYHASISETANEIRKATKKLIRRIKKLERE
jgi:hypothetical protein